MPDDGWRPAPSAALPAAGEVHLWRIGLAPSRPVLARLEAVLAPDERARAARFRFPEHRRQYAAGRGALRWLLGAYLGVSPSAVRFAYTPHGKPALDAAHGGGDAGGLRFNLTNCDDLALAAFSVGREIGVDLERLRPMPDGVSIAERFFSAPENAVFRTLGDDVRDRAFFHCWTRKEAYVKAVGEGLSMPLDRFDVTFLPGEEARLVATRPDETEAARWTLRDVDPGDGWIGALMMEGAVSAVTRFDWVPADG